MFRCPPLIKAVMHQRFQLKPRSFYLLCAALTGIFFVAHMYLFQSIPLLAPDSIGYINFSPRRPIGYPVLLWIFHLFNPSYSLVPYIQLMAYDLAALYMTLNFYRLAQAPWLSLGLLAGTLINVGFIQLSFFLITDAVWSTFLMIMLGILMHFSFCHKRKYIYVLWTLAGSACLLRPTSYALVPVLMLLPLFTWKAFKNRFWKTMGISLGIFLTILMMGIAGQALKNGFFRTESFLGCNLMGKVSLILEPGIPSSSPQFLERIVPQSQNIQRIIAYAPDLQARYRLSAPYYDFMRFQVIHPQIEDLPSLEGDLFLRRVAFEVIRAKPQAYLQEILLQYIALWQCWELETFKEQKAHAELIRQIEAIEWSAGSRQTLTKQANCRYGFPAIVMSVRATLAAAFLASLAFPLIGLTYLWRRQPLSPLLCGGIFASLIIQSGYIVIASFQAGLPRYSLSFWPCVILILAIALRSVMKDK